MHTKLDRPYVYGLVESFTVNVLDWSKVSRPKYSALQSSNCIKKYGNGGTRPNLKTQVREILVMNHQKFNILSEKEDWYRRLIRKDLKQGFHKLNAATKITIFK